MIEKVLARLGKPGANRYFFDKLNNPEWIEPLYERGFFKRPPAPDRNPEKGTVSFPDWPELRFLVRMADQASETVGRIVAAIPETENARIRELQVQIASQLPIEHSQKIATRAVEWLRDPVMFRHFVEPFAGFIAHLLQQGDTKGALRLTRRLFAAGEDGGRQGPQLDEWHYERYLLRCLPALRDLAGIQTLAVLRDLLLQSTREPQSGQSDDFSYIWRRDLSKSNFRVKQHRDVLIDAVLDTAIHLSRLQEIGFAGVRKTLLDRPRSILTRIAIAVAERTAAPSDPFVMEVLVNTKLADRMTYRVEYASLLRSMFSRLTDPERSRVVEVLRANPLENIPATAELSDEKRAQLAKVILRDRLTAFGDSLPAAYIAEKEALVAQIGQAEERPAVTAVWGGPSSPIALETLRAEPIPQIVEYLRTWMPSNEFAAPSREGLARDLQSVAKDDAARWSSVATAFAGLHPTYVRGLMLGFNDACSAKVSIDWHQVFALCRWVLEQPRNLVPGHNALDEGQDPDWSWTRQAIARLVTTGLQNAEAGLPWTSRDAVGEIVHELLDDPDPAGEGNPTDDNEPLATAINSVRGLAAHCLLRFGWWIHNHLAPVNPPELLSFGRMPEICSGLEQVLADPAPALHSVLGEWFRTIFYFDRAWASSRIDSIFPQQEDRRPYWLASWRAFIDYDQPYDLAFDVLRPKYVMGVDRLQGVVEDDRKRMGETGLGVHLSSYYWRGVGGQPTTDLLFRFFEICTPSAAAQVLWSLGAGLESADPISPATMQALTNLWTTLRVQSAAWTELKRREVNRHFGRWFRSGRFEAAWALEELKQVIATGAGIVDIEGILDKLAKDSAAYPILVADILAALLKDSQEVWQPLLWQSQVESVLKSLLASKTTGVRERAEQIANDLIQNGSLFARDLLKGA